MANGTAQQSTQGTKNRLTPTLFIGVGGTGLSVLRSFKALNEEAFGTSLPVYDYVTIDTRDNHQDLGSIDVAEECNLASVREVKFAGRLFENLDASAPYLRDWMVDTGSWKKFADLTEITEGADQCRALGRALFSVAQGERVTDKIRGALGTIMSTESATMLGQTGRYSLNPEKGPEVYIVGSVSGGTGSGMILDIAYLCRELAKAWPATKIYGVLGLSNLFPTSDPERKRSNEANAYAALRELDHFMRGNPYQMRYAATEVKFSGVRPFNMCFLVDSPNENGACFDGSQPKRAFDDMCDMMAQGLFCLTSSVMETSYAAYLTNMKVCLTTEIPNNNGVKYRSSYSSFGMAALRFPYEQVVDYCSAHRAAAVCDRVTADAVQKDAKVFTNDVTGLMESMKLAPGSMLEDLRQRVDWTFRNWHAGAEGKLIRTQGNKNVPALDEADILTGMETQKATIDSALQAQKAAVSKNAEMFLDALTSTDADGHLTIPALSKAIRSTVNSFEDKGLSYGLKVLGRFQTMLRNGVSDMLDQAKREDDNSGRTRKAYESLTDPAGTDESGAFRGPIKRLVEQSFWKDLVDFDKNQELARLVRESLGHIRSSAAAALAAHTLQTAVEVYRTVEEVLAEEQARLQALKDLVEGADAALESRADVSGRIEAKYGSTFTVLREGGAEAIYEEIFGGADLATEIRGIYSDLPAYRWAGDFEEPESLADYLQGELRTRVERALAGHTLAKELDITGLRADFFSSNLGRSAAPYVALDPAIPTRDRPQSLVTIADVNYDKGLWEQLGTGMKAVEITQVTYNDRWTIQALVTKHCFPLFALFHINDWKIQSELERAEGGNPCYTVNDEILSELLDITPSATEAASLGARAVHALDLGEMTGFLMRKGKGRVYYHCSQRGNIRSGYTIASKDGGGRQNTKEFLLDAANRHILEDIEQQVSAYLQTLDSSSLEEIAKEWKTFKHKAVDRGKKGKEGWFTPKDGKNMPDYSPDSPDPKILRDLLESRNVSIS